MTFQELVDEVILITKRPDLLERTKSAVRAATLKMHHSDFYYKDLVEFAVEFDAALHVQNFIPSEIIPKYRKTKYLRMWLGDAVSGEAGKFLEQINIENAVDAYQCSKVDVFYLAGQLLQIRTNSPIHRFLFGAYIHPTLTPEMDFKSWIADEYPYAIIYEAARSVFFSIAATQQSQAYGQLTSEILSEMKMSSVDALPFT